ncbi:MAG: hypothetical protein IJC16_01830 [Rikenellaceae bacterium]|nr:hypothetical protein [Rikenellaceae bacterium]
MLLAGGQCLAQKFVWDVTFDSRFDNREYKSAINWPQTLFGARLTPEVGLGWGEGNSIRLGTNLQADFGARSFYTDPSLVMYYAYESDNFNAYAGLLPRRKVMGDYPTAFFSDSVKFYDPNIDGLLLQYKGRLGYIELSCDWTGMITNTDRERFMVFSSGRIGSETVYGGYFFDMHHFAGTYLVDGVVDNVLIEPYVGVSLARQANFEKLSLEAGWINAFQHVRALTDGYVKPHGVELRLRVQKYRFGIFNTLYMGGNLQPYFATHGPELYMGDPWYRVSRTYDRLEIYWHPIEKPTMNLKVSSVHHFDGKKWGWQQVIAFWVNINNKTFEKKK